VSNVHVAIIEPDLADPLAAGRKRIESRFARGRRLPFGRVFPGDEVYFKVAGAEIIGLTSVRRVIEFVDLNPARITAIRRRFGRSILAPPAYWRARRGCRYGVLIWLGRFTSIETTPRVPRQFGNAWLLLPGRPRRAAESDKA
jgi:hypothetical protein